METLQETQKIQSQFNFVSIKQVLNTNQPLLINMTEATLALVVVG